jgi:hypothetical protein
MESKWFWKKELKASFTNNRLRTHPLITNGSEKWSFGRAKQFFLDFSARISRWEEGWSSSFVV